MKGGFAMNVASILQSKGRNVVTARPARTIAYVVEKLKGKGIGALVVSEDRSAVLGIISERDILRGLAEHGARVLDMRVADLMTRDVITCSPATEIDELMGVMTENRIRHLPVVEDEALSGIVTIGDVVKSRLEQIEHDAQAMREYIATG